jgi:hypothetical protein
MPKCGILFGLFFSFLTFLFYFFSGFASVIIMVFSILIFFLSFVVGALFDIYMKISKGQLRFSLLGLLCFINFLCIFLALSFPKLNNTQGIFGWPIPFVCWIIENGKTEYSLDFFHLVIDFLLFALFIWILMLIDYFLIKHKILNEKNKINLHKNFWKR